MSEYIGRDAVYEMLENAQMISDGEYCGYCTEDVTISSIPAADVALVRHGRWVEYENEADKGFHYCSECKHQAVNYDEGERTIEVLSDYCPNCGAKMDLPDECEQEVER